MFENTKQIHGKRTEIFNYIPTDKFASYFHVKPESVRRAYCLNGHYLGIQPIKLPNGRLLWPQEPIGNLLPME